MIKVGDEVINLSPHNPFAEGKFIVIGFLDHSPDIAVIASDAVMGVTLNCRWLDKTGKILPIQASNLRLRYMRAFPSALSTRNIQYDF